MSLIPIKCFSCGTVIADKYEYYCEEVRRRKLLGAKGELEAADRVTYLTRENQKKTPEAEVLDEIGLTKSCCRTVMLTHVDIE